MFLCLNSKRSRLKVPFCYIIILWEPMGFFLINIDPYLLLFYYFPLLQCNKRYLYLQLSFHPTHILEFSLTPLFFSCLLSLSKSLTIWNLPLSIYWSWCSFGLVSNILSLCLWKKLPHSLVHVLSINYFSIVCQNDCYLPIFLDFIAS